MDYNISVYENSPQQRGGIDFSKLEDFVPTVNVDRAVEAIFGDETELPDQLIATLRKEESKEQLQRLFDLKNAGEADIDIDEFYIKQYDPVHDGTGPGPERPYYRRNRYDIKKSNSCGVFKNADEAVKFQLSQGNISIDVPLNQLRRNSSDGTTPWESYNWVFVQEMLPDPRDPLAEGTPGPFHFIFARHDSTRSAEMGLKHTMLGIPNRLWGAGEMRIITLGPKTVYQFNLNSSLNSTPSILEKDWIRSEGISSFVFRKFMAHLTRLILEQLVNAPDDDFFHKDLNSEIQFVEELVVFDEPEGREISHSGRLITTGIQPHYGSIDPVHGLLYYYYEPDPPCPEQQYVEMINELSKEEGDDYYYDLHTMNNSSVRLEDLIKRLKAMKPAEGKPLLSLLSTFITRYYGLYFLSLLVKLTNKRRLTLLFHGGYKLMNLFDPTVLHSLVTNILLSRMSLAEKTFAIESLFTSDIDYLTDMSTDIAQIEAFIESLTRLLNGDREGSDQIELFNKYFTGYYFQKDCKKKIKFKHKNLNNEIFRIEYQCGGKVEPILDIFRTPQYAEHQVKNPAMNANPLGIFLTDLSILLGELAKSPTPIQIKKAEKRIYRANAVFSLIPNGQLNYYQYDFSQFDPQSGLVKSLIALWQTQAKKFQSKSFQLLTVNRNGTYNLVKGPIALTEALFQEVSQKIPPRSPYVLSPTVTGEQVRETTNRFRALDDDTVIRGSTDRLKDIKAVIRGYTGSYYHTLNSCLYNYLYDKKCDSELVASCQSTHRFIVYFSELANKDLFKDTIRVFRAENNVSLGLIGGYYQCKEGDTFINPTFWSTSYNRVVNLDQKKILLEIELSPDDAFLIIENLSSHRSESEVLIPFGSIFQVRERQLATRGGQNYLLIKLKCTGRIRSSSLREFYQFFHRHNYSFLPNDRMVPITDWSELLTCKRLVKLNTRSFLELYNAVYSHTLPISLKYRNTSYVLKFYLYRKNINGVSFPNRDFIHPLDIELNVYRLTQGVLDYGYVTPNLLKYYPEDNGVCHLDQVKELIAKKRLCTKPGRSWICGPSSLDTTLSLVPYRLLEKADHTAETVLRDGRIALIEYLFKIFYTVNILGVLYGFVHFDLKPGNIFFKEVDEHISIYRWSNYFSFTSNLELKIADYDASFLRGIDNVFISRDTFHQRNISPLTFAEADRSRLDVKLLFLCHRNDIYRNLSPEMRAQFDYYESLSSGLTVTQYLNRLSEQLTLEGYDGTCHIDYTLSNTYSLKLFSSQYSRFYQTYFPVLHHHPYSTFPTNPPSFKQFTDPFVLTNQAVNFEKRLRIMTYNVHEWLDTNRRNKSKEMWSIIKGVNPDILVIQEGVSTVSGPGSIGATGYFGYGGGMIDTIKGSTEYTTAIRCKADVHLYNYIYAKDTISSIETLFNDKIGADDRCAVILLCTMAKYNYKFIIINTHLSVQYQHQDDNVRQLLSTLRRVIAEHELADEISNKKVDIYLTGDFNSYSRPRDRDELEALLIAKRDYYASKGERKTRPEMEAILFQSVDQFISHEFIDSYDLYEIQHGQPSYKPLHTSIHKGKIDHIMVNNSFSKPILGCYQIMDNSSDHTPLVVDVLLEYQCNRDFNFERQRPEFLSYWCRVLGIAEVPTSKEEWDALSKRHREFLDETNCSEAISYKPILEKKVRPKKERERREREKRKEDEEEIVDEALADDEEEIVDEVSADDEEVSLTDKEDEEDEEDEEDDEDEDDEDDEDDEEDEDKGEEYKYKEEYKYIKEDEDKDEG